MEDMKGQTFLGTDVIKGSVDSLFYWNTQIVNEQIEPFFKKF